MMIINLPQYWELVIASDPGFADLRDSFLYIVANLIRVCEVKDEANICRRQKF
ncbi:hypothetical protein EME01_61750 [Sinorhizobium meliloti]|nr:hypothetical protein EME01_61750 [Sinorhizobium meliloti]